MLMKIYTIGHSTHESEKFLEALKAHGIQLLIDVRTIPKSRHTPQFNTDVLEPYLKEHGISYLHMKELGGLRHTTKDSVNTGWKNASFRGYADYMQTEEFSRAIDALIELAKEKTTAIMCAEAVPWRCHRSLIADALTVKGVNVFHIMTEKTANEHKMTEFAQVKNGKLWYPAAEKQEKLTYP